MNRGKFITVEGGEGAGKSTNLDFIQQYLERFSTDSEMDQGISVVRTREPGGTGIGEKLRLLLLDKEQSSIVDDAELLMMFAARAQHLQQIILPALEAGQWVLCDRFTDASYAYQGGGRGIPVERIATLENWVQGDIRPDLTILLDLDVAKGLERASNRSEPDRFELEQQAFFQRVRQAYLDMAKTDQQRYRIVDASVSLDAVQKQISEVLNTFCGNLR